jgi:hypothetical protein
MELISLALDEVRRQAGAKLSSAEALTYLCADWLGGEAKDVKTAERYQVIVHVGEDGKSWVDTEGGAAPLKPSIVERLLCDCTIRLQREAKDGTMAVSRAQRTVSEVTRRAIAARDGRRCRVPGCRRRCWLDTHHLVWYSRGGRHQIKNLIFLCRWHHAQHHDGKLLIEVSAKGELRFRAKAGWVLGEGGELTPNREWLERRLAKDEKPDAEALEVMAALEGDVEQAFADTAAEDRGWMFARATGWEVRERGVVYGERSRGIAAVNGAKRSRGIVLSGLRKLRRRSITSDNNGLRHPDSALSRGLESRMPWARRAMAIA